MPKHLHQDMLAGLPAAIPVRSSDGQGFVPKAIALCDEDEVQFYLGFRLWYLLEQEYAIGALSRDIEARFGKVPYIPKRSVLPIWVKLDDIARYKRLAETIADEEGE